MKKQRYRFKVAALFLLALFVALGAYGVWSVTHFGSRWFSYAANPRLAALKETVTEGSILDRNGTVLARTEDGKRLFQENAADRKAVVHVIGDRSGRVANAVETFHAGYLYGYQSSLQDAIHRLTHPGEARRGNDVTLTIDAELCREIPAFFDAHPLSAGKNGAAAVINYRTGEVIALCSLPSFDPDNADAETIAALDHPYWNRATQGLYPPGSTFKIVTAAAALERMADAGTRTWECSGALQVNDSFTVHDFRSAVHGRLTLRQAFARSCNNVFAQLALDMGDGALRQAAERFGFNRNFLFRDLVVYNSVYPTEKRTAEAVAASGYGQSALTATPLHLCLTAAAVAGGGRMPEPRLLREVKSASGAKVLRFSAAEAMTVCPEAVARELADMMKDTVQGGGSGSAAAVATLDVRGKTGTAESTLQGEKVNYGWFVGYNAQEDLPFALCVLAEDIPEGETGGTVCAPIAREILTWLKNHPDRVM